jgi:ABC-2 type transport system ATP-binding protein
VTAVSEASSEPLLKIEDLRVDVDDVPVCDGLTLQSRGERVLVLGAPRVVFEASCALRPVMRGLLRVRGAAPEAAVRGGVVTGAPLDPPLPPKWSAVDYVTWSSRLAGHTSADARRLAKDAIADVQLGPLASGPLERMLPHARRAVVVAAALATGASVIALEDPLAQLPEEIAMSWAKILVQALGERSWLVFAPHVPLTSPLAMSADEALMVSSSRLDAQGPPAELAAAGRRFVARIHSTGPLETLGARLSERGATMDIQGAQVLLDLGSSMTTSDLLGLCAELDATVVEMVPVARALT